MTYDPEVVMDSVKGGSKDAFTTLYQAEWDGLVGYLLRWCGCRFDAEEFAQAAFSMVWEKRSTWRTAKELEAEADALKAKYLAICPETDTEVITSASRLLALFSESRANKKDEICRFAFYYWDSVARDPTKIASLLAADPLTVADARLLANHDLKPLIRRNFRRWLRKIARNKYLDAIEGQQDGPLPGFPVPGGWGGGSAVAEEYVAVRVSRAFGALSRRDQEVIRRWLGYSPNVEIPTVLLFDHDAEAIAKDLGISLATCYRALETFNRKLSYEFSPLREFALRLLVWGDGREVPTSGRDLIVVGIDNDDKLHVRVIADGVIETDMDETELHRVQAEAVKSIKSKFPRCLPPRELTNKQINNIITDVIYIVKNSILFFLKFQENGREVRGTITSTSFDRAKMSLTLIMNTGDPRVLFLPAFAQAIRNGEACITRDDQAARFDELRDGDTCIVHYESNNETNSFTAIRITAQSGS